MKERSPLLGLLLLVACKPSAPTAAVGALPPGHLLIAHTNDLHTHYLPTEAPWLPGDPEIGGFGPLSAHLTALRAQAGEGMLYLDGGDLLTGTPLMELTIRGVQGGGMLELLEASGCDAWTVGNHEFDRGFENAAALVAQSRIPALSANLDAPGTDDPAMPGQLDHLVIEANGLRVGIFGLTTDGLGHLASPATMAHMEVEPVVGIARHEVAALEWEGVDLVVALTHTGIEVDRVLAAQVQGIDLIVGGHSHTSIHPPEQVGETWIVQAGSYNRQLGLSELVVEGGRIVSFSDRLIDLLPDSLPGPELPEVVDLVEGYRARIDAAFSVPVGQSEASLDRRGDIDSPLGRWAAEMVRQEAGADVGLVNPGGLRADLPGGSLVRGDVYEVFPFNNEVVSFELSGSELVGLILRSIQGIIRYHRAPLQWAGVEVDWRVWMGAPDLVRIMVGGAPIELERRYRIATNSFIAEQWEHQLGVEPQRVEQTGHTMLEAAIIALARAPARDPGGPRLRAVDAD